MMKRMLGLLLALMIVLAAVVMVDRTEVESFAAIHVKSCLEAETEAEDTIGMATICDLGEGIGYQEIRY